VHKYSREVGTEKKNRLKILAKMYMDMFTINRLVKCSMILLVLLKLDKAVLYTVVVAQLKVVVHLVIYFPYLLYIAECIMRSLRLTTTNSMDTSSVKGVHHTVVAVNGMPFKEKYNSRDFNFNHMLYFNNIIKILFILTEYTMEIFRTKMCTTQECQSRRVWSVKMMQTTNFLLLWECFSGRRPGTQFVIYRLAESFSSRAGTCGG